MKIKISVIFIVLLFALVSCQKRESLVKKPVAVKGVIDLRGWDFSKNGSINLDGEWGFYWKQFLSENNFNSNTKLGEKNYISVPGVWNGYLFEGSKLPGIGYASYRLLIKLNTKDKPLALRLPTISTAYSLWVNGRKLAHIGLISKSKKGSSPGANPEIVELEPINGQIELVFHVSNFDYSKGGLWYSIKLGQVSDIKRSWDISFYRDVFLFGSILIIGLFYFSIFFLRRKEKAALAFGLLCVIIALRVILTGQLFVNILIPSFSWSTIIRLEYLTFYLGIPLYLTFIRYLFPKDISFLFIRIFRILSSIFILIVIITSVKTFTGIIVYYQLLVLIGAGYLLYIHIITIARKRDYAPVLAFGFLFLFVTLINDLLFSNNKINTGEIFPFGLFVFIIIQAFVLADRFLKSFSSVERLSEEITDAEKRYRSIFENSMEGIYRTSKKGEFLMVNPAFARIFGYDNPEEIIKLNIPYGLYVDKKVKQTLINKLVSDGILKNAESMAFKKNGEIIEVKENAHVVWDKNGKIKYFEGNIIDITEIKQIEKLKLAREAAEAANKTKSDFLANMSHEIRTPMNAIIGFTDILLDSEEEPERKEQLGIIKNAGNNLLKLINDILDFSKIEAEKLDIKEDSFSLVDLINNTKNLFSKKAESKNIKLIVEFNFPLPNLICGDKYKLIQVLNNLIGNALKFTAKGSIKIVCNYKEGKVIISIIDTGIGIASDKQEIVFLSFSQADMSTEREYGGSGLGLAISKKLVELMGGQISLKSEKGKGSTFKIEIPFSIVNEDDAVEQSKIIRTISGSSEEESRRVRILLAEDNRINQKLVSALLAGMNLKCDVADNGREALDKLKVSDYDLLLLDMQMPVMDGLQTISNIRKDDELKKIYVIALTANAIAGDEVKYINAGCNDYISKPIDRELFKKKVYKIINSD